VSAGAVILATGDSHSLFWRGRDTIKACDSLLDGVLVAHLGASTAYGIARADSPRAANLANLLYRRRDTIGMIITCFGEIDCRTHVVKQAELQQRSIDSIADELADRYLGFVSALARKYAKPVAIWGPPPSTPPDHHHHDDRFPTHGTVVERNRAVGRFSSQLRLGAAGCEDVAFFTAFDDLIDENGATKPNALYDGCHLSVAHMPLALGRLDAILARFNRSALKPTLRSA
jgi:hypothetical protein